MSDRRNPTLLPVVLAASLVLLAGCKADGTPDASGGAPPPSDPVPPPVVETPPPAPPAPAPTTPGVTPVTSLPQVPELTNVRVLVNGNSATITYDTVDDARDYRVYALPPDSAINLNGDGSVTIPNATYRCAGTWQVPDPQQIDDTNVKASGGITTRVASKVDGYTRSVADATLGHVYTTANAAPDLVPVYAVGSPDVRADGDFFYRYQASRDKKYTTSATEYAQLVASGWRDDGIAFYVPAQAGATTKPVLTNTNVGDPASGSRYYLNQGTELSSRNSALNFVTAFNVLASPAAGTRPLMRVFYQPFAGRSHDELAVGQADFIRIRNQGLENPANVLHFSGLTGATTLVVEALDKGCPFQGIISPRSVAAETFQHGSYVTSYKAWRSVADMRAAVPDGEVYINGQHDGVSGRPKAIARAFVNVSPRAREQMDWVSTPASFAEPFTQLSCQAPPDQNCFQEYHLRSSSYDVSFHYAETNHWQVGNVLGQFLVTYADWAADSNGKFRMTVRNQKANITAGSFVHATMEVNSVGSGRRYPQLILSDQDFPVQHNLIKGRSLILQTFSDFPSRVDLEICDHVNWDVNEQCPRFVLRHRMDQGGNVTGINPLLESDGYMAALDAPVRFDLYVSNTRAYIFVNSKPYGCANLAGHSGVSPAPVAPTGPVTVTFGDVLYHSGVDEDFVNNMPKGFVRRNHLNVSSRHYENLGFSSGVSAPAWNESRIPCSSTMTTLGYDPGV